MDRTHKKGFSSVERHANRLREIAKRIVDEGEWHDVTQGGDGEPGELWEMLVTGKRSYSADLADDHGVETKFVRGPTGNIRLMHKAPPNWGEILRQMHKASSGTRWSHTITRKNRGQYFDLVVDDRDVILRPVKNCDRLLGCSDIVWPRSVVDNVSKKMCHLILGRGTVRENRSLDRLHSKTQKPLVGKEVLYTGFRFLSDFVGGGAFVERVRDGDVRIEIDASSPDQGNHDHGPKFTILYTHRGALWKLDVGYGECEPKKSLRPMG